MRKRPKSKTAEEYQSRYEESQKIIKHLLTVEEPSVEDAVEILWYVYQRYEDVLFNSERTEIANNMDTQCKRAFKVLASKMKNG